MKVAAGVRAHRVRVTNLLDNKPSLLQGSIQKLKVPVFKTDPRDMTISISILIVKAYNAKHIGALV